MNRHVNFGNIFPCNLWINVTLHKVICITPHNSDIYKTWTWYDVHCDCMFFIPPYCDISNKEAVIRN